MTESQTKRRKNANQLGRYLRRATQKISWTVKNADFWHIANRV